ncbi:MAG TPA: CoB--CoM heterodisulfide reductase iron-sulfur subunit B family protein [Bacteroidales bacterium]|nr:CoB--CoM heterodisulfide reductase iron-sulfur subunit B family protein [Bacteroidales bacterium]HPS72972.1 CoB--CoM heterodisulfide reductase iron-sulfur subunit B family protein [Bacteroidales bacterium]
MKKLTYFPGCSAHGTSEEFDHTLRKVMKTLEVELEEIPDWNCCGATSAHAMTDNLAMALPMRNLILAEKMDNKTMGIPCASCYSRMKTAKYELEAHPELAQKLSSIVEEGTFKGTVEVKSMLQFCYEEVGLEKIKSLVKYPLTGLKVACYYGCLLTRPKAVTQFDSPEYPMSMDRLVEALGATAVDFDYKTECCGASFAISTPEVVLNLSGKILEMAKEAGAHAMVVACPLCQSNLDMRQPDIEKLQGVKYNIPVFYFTQLMALAFGYPVSDLLPGKHIVPIEPALARIGETEEPAEKVTKPKKAVEAESEDN